MNLTKRLSAATPGGAFGVYVHVPFCSRRCDYCAFATWTDRAGEMGRHSAATRAHLAAAVAGGLPAATSVFVGGGTPSLLPAAELVAILAAVPRAPGAEVTVECNPESVTADSLAAYAEAGVTRLSFGVQSFVPHVLAALGRAHDPGMAVRAVALARAAGFDEVNLDLIMGGAGESCADWRRSLEAALDLGPDHVSAYALTVEPGTPLAADPARHPDDDDQAAKYELADEVLRAAGLDWYEVSNWARPGAECRHNRLYWAQGDYLGVGCAAHSHVGGVRWWNLRTPERYAAAVEASQEPVAAEEHLAGSARVEERHQLALRTRAGVPADAFAAADRALLVEAGLLAAAGGRVVLTRRGRLLANEVALRLRPGR